QQVPLGLTLLRAQGVLAGGLVQCSLPVRASTSDGVDHTVIVLVARVLEQAVLLALAGPAIQIPIRNRCPRPYEHSGIVHGDPVLERLSVGAREAFGQTEGLAGSEIVVDCIGS